jgi:pyrroline-5-carboxylate reductase
MNRCIGFIGAGHIAEMMISRVISTGVVAPSRIYVSDIDEKRLVFLKDKFGLMATSDNRQLFQDCDHIFFCVHPPVVRKVLDDIYGLEITGKLIVSIAAGIPMDTYRYLGNVAVLRAIPNPPSKIGCGIIPYALNTFVEEKQTSEILEILSSLGECIPMTEEAISIVTSLSSPVSTLLFMDSLVEAGVLAGISRDDSVKIVYRTVLGSLEMWEQDREKSFADLLAQACTPGGVSAETLFTLDRHAFRSALKEAIMDGVEKARGFSGTAVAE